jgi:hypothetical protein
MTYAASLFQHAFNNPDKVWAKHVFRLQAKACKGRAFWDAMTVRSVRQLYGYNPKNGLRSWEKIQKHATDPITFPSHLSFRELKRLIQPLPPPLTPTYSPPVLDTTFNWNMVFNGDLPPKIQEILWRAAYNAQPNKSRLHHINPSQFTNLCDLCVGYEETSKHMYSDCRALMPFWTGIKNITDNKPMRLKRYLRGIAFQAIWYAHQDHRLKDTNTNIALLDIQKKYIIMLAYYKARTRKTALRLGWPSMDLLRIHFPAAVPSASNPTAVNS